MFTAGLQITVCHGDDMRGVSPASDCVNWVPVRGKVREAGYWGPGADSLDRK